MSRRRTRCVPSVHMFSRHRVLRVVFAHRAPLSLARPRLHRSARRRRRPMMMTTMRVPQNAATFCPSGKRHRAFARATSPSAVAASLPQNDRGIHHASPVRPFTVFTPRISNLDERHRRRRASSHDDDATSDCFCPFQIFRFLMSMSFRKVCVDVTLKGVRWSLSKRRGTRSGWEKKRQKTNLI